MARFGSDKVAFFLVGGRSILGSRTAIDFDARSTIKAKTPLGVTAQVKEFVGTESATLTQKGWFDEATGGVNEAVMGATGRTSQVVCVGFEDNVLGARMIGLAGGLVGSYKAGVAVEDFQSADAQMECSGAIDDQAKILALHVARTGATWVTTAIDNGGASAAGLAAYLQVSALTLGGYTNAVIKVQHSILGTSTWVDLITFTVVTAAPTAERKTVTGDVYQYLRVSASYTGAGSGQSITALVGAERY
jgi:hypothetical protein